MLFPLLRPLPAPELSPLGGNHGNVDNTSLASLVASPPSPSLAAIASSQSGHKASSSASRGRGHRMILEDDLDDAAEFRRVRDAMLERRCVLLIYLSSSTNRVLNETNFIAVHVTNCIV
jgi:hypothetical protein